MSKDLSIKFWNGIEQLKNISLDEIQEIIQLNHSKTVPFPENMLLKQIQQRDSKLADESEKKHLLPARHPDGDFFIADGIDLPYVRDDLASMDYPIFALKPGDTRVIKYELHDLKTIIRPSADIGRATIFDKDVWIYCISKLMQAKYEGKKISKTLRFSTYDFLIQTNKKTGGSQYEQFQQSLARLTGTRIQTEIETGGIRQTEFIGLIDSAKVIEEDIMGRTVAVEITLPDWLYRSVVYNDVTRISKDYFRLRKPIDRRIYEIASKFCGKSNSKKISLEKLYQKTGATMVLRNFRVALNSLVVAKVLPDFLVEFDRESDMVTFTKRDIKTLVTSLVKKW